MQRTAATAATNVRTRTRRGVGEVLLLRKALLNGDSETGRPELPEDVVAKILEKAEYWPYAIKSCGQFSQGNLDMLFFKFGPVPGTPKKITVFAESHDQGWSSYPEDEATYNNSWTWGEVDIKGKNGVSKLGNRRRVFTNLHAVSDCQQHMCRYYNGDILFGQFEEGDCVEFYFRAQFPGWRIHVRRAEMAVFYESHLQKA